MIRYLSAALLAAILILNTAGLSFARSIDAPGPYTQGFAQLHQALGDTMGDPVAAPSADENGDVQQLTTEGLAYWLKDSNLPVFTNGVNHYALGDSGLLSWAGDSILPVAPPVVQLAATSTSPRQYLYSTYPSIAADLDCIISHESRWNPFAKNPRSTATGLAQFLDTTWATVVPAYVRQGRPRTDPYAAIDGAAWLYLHVGRTQWEVVLKRLC